MSKIIDEAGLANALGQIAEHSVYFNEYAGDIIVPNTRCYTKADIDLELGKLWKAVNELQTSFSDLKADIDSKL